MPNHSANIADEPGIQTGPVVVIAPGGHHPPLSQYFSATPEPPRRNIVLDASQVASDHA